MRRESSPADIFCNWWLHSTVSVQLDIDVAVRKDKDQKTGSLVWFDHLGVASSAMNDIVCVYTRRL